jgi:DNA repair exonuclease SbcCD nuclease subunit
MSAPRPARILHTSDCHLDEVNDGLHQRAFAASIDLSIELDVSLVLITGDMFDHSRSPPTLVPPLNPTTVTRAAWSSTS